MRADLRALTPETLAELTNRGLVKRASRELERAVPAIAEDAETTVHASFVDGVTTELPVGGLERGKCSCGATGVCRHIVGLVLAYQATPAGPPAEPRVSADQPQPAEPRVSADQPQPAEPRVSADQPQSAEPAASAGRSQSAELTVLTDQPSAEPAVSAGWSQSAELAVSTDQPLAEPMVSTDEPQPAENPGRLTHKSPPDRPRHANQPDLARHADQSGHPDLPNPRDAALPGHPDRRGRGKPEPSNAGDAAGTGPPATAEPSLATPDEPPTAEAERGESPPGQSPPGQSPPGQSPPGQSPPGELPGGEWSPGELPRGEWSPGKFTDAQLVERIGERMVAAARRIERTGYIALVHRARPGDLVSSVELPTATVRFLVPGDLGFARTDAVAGVRDDVLALAVWAFREADARFPAESDVQVQVGGNGTAASGPGLESAVALAGVVLREGAVHIGAGLAADVTAVRRALEAGRMRWPLLAVDDLVAQLEAYRDRSARYRPEALADHVAEVFARHRAVTGPASERALRSRVLGTDEASETPLRRARLDGLGARVTAFGADRGGPGGPERVVEIFLAHATSATVLVLRRSYETVDTGPQLAARRVAGVSVGSLAGGAVVTESAARSASRAVRLSTRRLSRTEAMTSRGSWQDLPRALIADDLTALARELDALPPRLVRARVEAELVRVIPVAAVLSVSYAPGAQRLDAVIADAAGVTAVVSAVHAACAPGRLDSMAAALRGDLRYVAGSVRRAGGGIVIDPVGFALDGSVVVPDLAAADRGIDPDDAPALSGDAVGLALDEAAALLAELAHGGLHHAPGSMPGRLRATASQLGKVGLRRVAETMTILAGRLGPDPGDAAVEAWVDAYLRVNLAADLR